PLASLIRVTDRIAAGDWETSLPSPGPDELGSLTRSFDVMVNKIRNTLKAMDIGTRLLEARTRELATPLETGRLATSLRTQSELLPGVVEFIRERFNLYYAQIYLVDEAKRFAVLRAGSGEVGKQLLDRKHRLDLAQISLVATAIQTSQPV